MTAYAVQAVSAVPMEEVRIHVQEPAVNVPVEVTRRLAGAALDGGINSLVCLSSATMSGLLRNITVGTGSAIPTGLFLGAAFCVKKIFDRCMAPCSQDYEGHTGGVTLIGAAAGTVVGLFFLDGNWPTAIQRNILLAGSLASGVFAGLYSLGVRK